MIDKYDIELSSKKMFWIFNRNKQVGRKYTFLTFILKNQNKTKSKQAYK